MVINARTMGICQPDKSLTSHDGALEKQYHRIKNDPHNTAGLPYEGTTQQITDLKMRHFIRRETPAGSTIATRVNAMNEVAEGNSLPDAGSLAAYHLPPFQAVIDAGTSIVMPYHAIPSTDKSAIPQSPLTEFEDVGFAFDEGVLDPLRSMGHRGHRLRLRHLSKMAWASRSSVCPSRSARR